jgi:hypothetical protein
MRSAAGKSPSNTAKYLRKAAVVGLGITAEYLRRTASAAAGSDLGTIIK